MMRRRDRRRGVLWVSLFGLVVASGCGGGSSFLPADTGVVKDDGKIAKDLNVKLYPCEVPGKACNAHDPCAINPVCGQDRLCYPSGVQNCDDGLDCTDDVCLGMGSCKNTAKDGFCALRIKGPSGAEVKCFKQGEQSPDNACLECVPGTSKADWTGTTGGTCDDGVACTKNDTCKEGTCAGTDYRAQCADKIPCTEDKCDGKGGCLGNPLQPGFCRIGNTCQKDQSLDTSGCNICDVAKSTSTWTPLPDRCQIGGKCYRSGETTTDRCSVCDPKKNKSGWTQIKGVCQIGGVCFKPAEKNPSASCAECDPLTSTNTWTVKGNECYIGGACVASGIKDPGGCSTCDPKTSKLKWTPAADKCKIAGTCYNKGAMHPLRCAACDPAKSQSLWTVVGNFCLINDSCYLPGVKDRTGCAQCTPAASTTTWTVIGNVCQIAGVCYKKGDKDSTGCAQCDPATSTTKWTVVGQQCQIDGKCYKSGDKDPSSTCRQCDSSVSKTAWTPVNNTCYIKGKCYNKGDKHPLVCGECDPATNRTDWTVKGSFCLIDDVCYLPSVPRKAGCGACDPNRDRYHWTPPANRCLIAGACFSKGDKDATGCRICDPAKSTFAWSPIPGCVIVSNPWALGAGGSSYDYGRDVDTDASGNVYVTGYVGNGAKFGNISVTAKGGNDVFVAKIAPNGTYLWVKTFGSVSSDYGYSLAVDGQGNVYVTGSFYKSMTVGNILLTAKGYNDIFVFKLSTSGQVLWANSGGGSSSDYAYGIAVDASGNAYVTGYLYNSGTFGSISAAANRDVFVGKVSSTGTWLWVSTGGGTRYDYGWDIAVDASGAAVVTGYFSSSATFGTQRLTGNGTDMFVAKLSSSGKWLWAQKGGGYGSDYGYGVALDASGNVFVTGAFFGTATFGKTTLRSRGSQDMYVAKLSPQGTFLWAKSAGSTSTDYGWGVDTDLNGNVYVGGYFRYTVPFGKTTLTSKGSYDVFAAKLSGSTGDFLWAKSGGGTSSDYGYAIAADNTGHVIVTGAFYTNATFGKTSLTASRYTDVLIWKIAQP